MRSDEDSLPEQPSTIPNSCAAADADWRSSPLKSAAGEPNCGKPHPEQSRNRTIVCGDPCSSFPAYASHRSSQPLPCLGTWHMLFGGGRMGKETDRGLFRVCRIPWHAASLHPLPWRSNQYFVNQCRLASKIVSNQFCGVATAIVWMRLNDWLHNFPSAPSRKRGRPP